MAEQFTGNVNFLDSGGIIRARVSPDGLWTHVNVGENGKSGSMTLSNGQAQSIRLEGGSGSVYIGENNEGGRLFIYRSDGAVVFKFDAQTAALEIGGSTNTDGDVKVQDRAGREVFKFNGDTAALYVGASGNEGDVIVCDSAGRQVLHLNGGNACLYVGVAGNEGDIIVRNSAGQDTIHLDGATGNISFANADCAEEFDVSELEPVEPGTVMVLDEAGGLRQSARAYDQKVAGVVSGAGELKPGIILDKRHSKDNRVPVALLGKVLCKVDAGCGAVEVGDLLATSQTPGHAMKASDQSRAFGAILGKALRSLKEGKDLIPILVALQ